VPTLRAFAPRFLDGHARATRQKPSGIAAKEMILRVHLEPTLGHKKLDAISNEDVQQLKYRLAKKAPKTVNNILTVLNTLLKKATEWQVLDRMPCPIKLLRVPKASTTFYDFDEYERFVAAAKATDPRAYLLVLLSGEAGLRSGEMVALEWRDMDLSKRQIFVQRSAWQGQVAAPKGGRLRYVPMTTRLTAALRDARHLRRRARAVSGERRTPHGEGGADVVAASGEAGGRREQRAACVASHVLFASGDARCARAGDSRTRRAPRSHDAQWYMHLSPAALEEAIQLLERPASAKNFGDVGETGDRQIVNVSG
jgi:integrase